MAFSLGVLLFLATGGVVLGQEAAPYVITPLSPGVLSGEFAVAPATVDRTLSPGAREQLTLTVRNHTNEPRRFSLTVEDISGTQGGGQTVLLWGDDTGPQSVRGMVELGVETITVPAASEARVLVSLSVPHDATPGGHYGSVVVAALPSHAAAASQVIARIASLFFITIPGSTTQSGELVSFSTVPKDAVMAGGEPVRFAFSFENSGDVHLAPYGIITITDMFGREAGSIALPPWYVLPASVRLREVSWGSDALFGRYTATLSLNRSYLDIVDEAHATFFVIPQGTRTALALLVVGIILVAGSMGVRRLRRRNTSSKL